MRFRPGARSLRMSLGIVVAAISAAGCAPVPDRARHDVAEYRRDANLRREELARYANDPGSLGNSPDCINAAAAERAASVGSLRELPPFRLPSSK